MIKVDREVRAFGSRIDGSPKSYSDLDLAIMDNTAIPQGVLAELKDAFQKSDLPFRVDILKWSGISSEFQNIIIKNHTVITI